MTRAKLVRVAFVRFSPKGKSYPARCDRRDIAEGHEVEVLMHVESDNAYYMDGIVDFIELHRWHCTCRVENLVSEVDYTISADGELARSVIKNPAAVSNIPDWKEKKRGYIEKLPAAVRSEMQDIYDAVSTGNGKDAYLSDGVWISADGSLDE